MEDARGLRQQTGEAPREPSTQRLVIEVRCSKPETKTSLVGMLEEFTPSWGGSRLFHMYFQIALLKPAKMGKISASLLHSAKHSLLVVPFQASWLSWQLVLLATLYPGSLFSS